MSDSFFRNKQQLFDRWAPNYDFLLTTIFYQAVHKRMLEFVTLPDAPQVLDLGCGTGRLLNRLAAQLPQLQGTGLDFSAVMLEQAQKRLNYPHRLQFLQGNVENLPLTDCSFDAVFNSISFLHYPRPDRVLAEVYRVLKPSGRFYLADYTVRDDIKIQQMPFSPGGLRFYSPTARERLMRDAGFATVTHHYLLGPVLLTIAQR
jgi:ubiquinone/menaquinone biosynthesis C-methylase UbiE